MTVPSSPTKAPSPGLSKTPPIDYAKLTKNYTPPSPSRLEISIGATTFRPFDPINPPPTLVHRSSSYKHSVFYRIPASKLHLIKSFQEACFELFPFGINLGCLTTDDSQGKYVEIILVDQKAVDTAVLTPIVVNDHTFYANPSVPPSKSLLKVHLSKLPILAPSDLHQLLLNTFSSFGRVRDIVLYFDDASNRFFCGNGAIYLDRYSDFKENESEGWAPLTYKIDLDSTTFCLGKWAKMEAHCVYCKQMGHTRKDCKEIPPTSRTCYNCHKRGHIARHCPRLKDDKIASSKRLRTDEDQPISVDGLFSPLPSQISPASDPTFPFSPLLEDSAFNTPLDTVATEDAESDLVSIGSAHDEQLSPPNAPVASISSSTASSTKDAMDITDSELSELEDDPLPEIGEDHKTASSASLNSTKQTLISVTDKLSEPEATRRVSPCSTKGVSPTRYSEYSSTISTGKASQNSRGVQL